MYLKNANKILFIENYLLVIINNDYVNSKNVFYDGHYCVCYSRLGPNCCHGYYSRDFLDIRICCFAIYCCCVDLFSLETDCTVFGHFLSYMVSGYYTSSVFSPKTNKLSVTTQLFC